MRYFILLSLILCLCTCCDSTVEPIDEKSCGYFCYIPPLMNTLGDSCFIDINGDSISDIKLKSIYEELIDYNWISNGLSSIGDSVLLSFGNRNSSIFNFIKYGDTINKGTVQWYSSSQLSGRGRYSASGIWGANGKSDGYIGVKLLKNNESKFAWMGLSVTESILYTDQIILNNQ